MKKLPGFARKIAIRLDELLENRESVEAAQHYEFYGYKRFYLLHIRKTGGSSINDIFLSLAGKESRALYEDLVTTPSHRVISAGKVFVGWNPRLINQGNYYYAFSHLPLHKLNLPKQTFTLACFRDPVKRVLSHYNMIMEYSINNVSHPCMEIEGRWLGDSFDEFIERIPREHLLNQLYMFSKSYDVNEAVGNIRELSHIIFTERFNEGIGQLNTKIGLGLRPVHIRKTSYKAKISGQSIHNLKRKLEKEYELLERVALI